MNGLTALWTRSLWIIFLRSPGRPNLEKTVCDKEANWEHEQSNQKTDDCRPTRLLEELAAVVAGPNCNAQDYDCYHLTLLERCRGQGGAA